MKYFSSVLFCILALNIFAQTDNKNLNTQLNAMKDGFMNKDYAAIADFTYPKVVEMMGGKENMIKTTEQTMEKMASQGFVFESISFEDPSNFFKKNGDMQCVITQVLVMNTPNGKVENKTALLAISSDNGDNWVFLDTSGMPKASVQNFYTNLHPDLNFDRGGKKKLN